MPQVLTDAEFEEKVTNSKGLVFVDFWATWCGPCRMIAPVIEEIANEREDILVCKCNVDEELPLAVQFGVNVIPTLVVLKNGRVAARTEGLAGKQNIIRLVENAI